MVENKSKGIIVPILALLKQTSKRKTKTKNQQHRWDFNKIDEMVNKIRYDV